jgi:hypothetical protein
MENRLAQQIGKISKAARTAAEQQRGGEQIGTAAEQHGQQQSNREEEHHLLQDTEEGAPHHRATQSTTQRSVAPTHQRGASSRGRKGVTLRRDVEGRSTLLDEFSR